MRKYCAENVAYVHDRGRVTALWIGDEELAKDPRAVLEDRSLFFRDDVEVIAEAERYYKSEGSTFSGWIVRRGGSDDYTDVIANKPLAMEQLRFTVADRFERQGK